MNCDRIQQLLPSFQDGSLEPSLKREAELHLGQCSKCAEASEDVSAIVNLTRQVILERRTPAGSGYLCEVREKIRKRSHSRSVVRWMVPAAAALFLAVSVGTYTLFLEKSVKYSSTHTTTGRMTQETSSPMNTATIDDNELIDAMYRYTDVTIDDLISRMDENELAAMLDTDER